MEELKLNNTYLISSCCRIKSITVLRISEKVYNILWNNCGKNTWELKENFHSTYKIVEDITALMQEIPEVQQPTVTYTYYPFSHPVSSTELELCTNCGGTGYIPDPNNTAGVKLCPVCMGTKYVMKKFTTKTD